MSATFYARNAFDFKQQTGRQAIDNRGARGKRFAEKLWVKPVMNRQIGGVLNVTAHAHAVPTLRAERFRITLGAKGEKCVLSGMA